MKKIQLCFIKRNFLITKYDPFKQKELCLVLIFSFIFSINLFAQESQVWDYPVHPGTPEWESLTSFPQRLDVFNVPDSLLKVMTTADLVKTCLTYPWLILIDSQNSTHKGYEFLKACFNGFRELEKRSDACHELILVYQKMNPDEIIRYKTILEQGKLKCQFAFTEAILSQRSILTNITENDLITLLNTMISIYEKEVKNGFSEYNLSMTCSIICTLLDQENIYGILIDPIPGFQRYIVEGYYIDEKKDMDKLILATKEYLNNLMNK